MSIADLRQRQKGWVWALTNFEVPEKAGAWNTLAILAHGSGYFFARLADLDGLKAMRGSSTMSYRHSENPTLTRPGGETLRVAALPISRREAVRDP